MSQSELSGEEIWRPGIYIANMLYGHIPVLELLELITPCKESCEKCIVCHEICKTDCFKLNCDCITYYHKKCVADWLNCNKTCPTCRKKITILD